MKKGKVLSKKHIVTATLVVCLAAAVWLNMRFSSFETVTGGDSLSDKQYYDTNSVLGQAVQTSGAVDKIATSRTERDAKRNTTVEQYTKTINNSSADNSAKTEALNGLSKITENIVNESSIETVIKAKGFSEALVIISDESVTVIVPSEGLLTSETLQIQDAVTSQIEIDLEKIKIIAVK